MTIGGVRNEVGMSIHQSDQSDQSDQSISPISSFVIHPSHLVKGISLCVRNDDWGGAE